MDRKSFRPDGWVRLIRNTSGVETCVPRDLPPELPWDTQLVTTLSAADRALGRLGGITGSLPNPRILVRSFVNREAVLSSRIEGTVASLTNLYLFNMNPEEEQRVPDVREVANYVRALDYGIERQRQTSFSLATVRELHAILLEGVRGFDKSRGTFRKFQNFITPTDRIEEASYIPPPHEHVLGLMEQLEKFINTSRELPLLIRLAMIHYQFEAIHPFEDGNGRVGRLLISILLDRERVIPYPVLYLSAFFQRHQRAYYDLLLGVSQMGNWHGWISFFLRGVADQATDAVERSRALLALRDTWAARVQKPRSSALLPKLIDMLFASPFVKVPDVVRTFEVSHTAAQARIDDLVAAGILEEDTSRKRNRIYAARAILRILEDPPVFDVSEPESTP